MRILLDQERFESSLVEMAMPHGVMMRMPSLGVRQREPAHEAREIPIVIRPQHQMPVIGHQAVGEDPHGHSLTRLRQHPLEGGIIAVFLEQRAPAIRAIEHVIDQVAWRGAEGTAHHDALMIQSPTAPGSSKWFLTPFPSSISTLTVS